MQETEGFKLIKGKDEKDKYLNGKILFDYRANEFVSIGEDFLLVTSQDKLPVRCFDSIIKQINQSKRVAEKVKSSPTSIGSDGSTSQNEISLRAADEIRLEELKAMGIKLTRTPRTLEEEEYLKLYNRIKQRNLREGKRKNGVAAGPTDMPTFSDLSKLAYPVAPPIVNNYNIPQPVAMPSTGSHGVSVATQSLQTTHVASSEHSSAEKHNNRDYAINFNYTLQTSDIQTSNIDYIGSTLNQSVKTSIESNIVETMPQHDVENESSSMLLQKPPSIGLDWILNTSISHALGNISPTNKLNYGGTSSPSSCLHKVQTHPFDYSTQVQTQNSQNVTYENYTTVIDGKPMNIVRPTNIVPIMLEICN